ncbi:MAG TPA: hypothetical protein VGS11_10910 [Candidatus Bathyarchaeia archaeon]|nr:hypothetical protein [Candidatus Bathyarchaeia archaeon]
MANELTTVMVSINHLKPEDAAWLAGFVDGEGSITPVTSIKENGRIYRYVRVEIRVLLTHQRPTSPAPARLTVHASNNPGGGAVKPAWDVQAVKVRGMA